MMFAMRMFNMLSFTDVTATAAVADYTFLRQSIQIRRRPLFFPLKKILTESKDTF